MSLSVFYCLFCTMTLIIALLIIKVDFYHIQTFFEEYTSFSLLVTCEFHSLECHGGLRKRKHTKDTRQD